MSKQNIDIPILGMDRRASYRQSNPGVCSLIENLEPTGAENNPYWKRIPQPELLMNNSFVSFPGHTSSGALLVDAAWHQRSYSGKYGNEGSLRRLVCFYSNGDVRVYDPGLNWGNTATKQFDYGSGTYSYSTTMIGNMHCFVVKLNGQAKATWFLVDDIFVESNIPELPVLTHSVIPKQVVTQTNLDDGIYEGIRPGSFYVMFAIETADGTLIKHSEPRLVETPTAATNTYQVKFVNSGYQEEPENINFWREQFNGISALIGGFKGLNTSGQQKGFDVEDLKDIQFYKATTLAIDVSQENEGGLSLTATFSDRVSDWPTNELANIDNFSNHGLTGSILYSYNSRLIFGGSAYDLSKPRTGLFDGGERPNFYTRVSFEYGQLIDPNDPESEYYPDEVVVEVIGEISGVISVDSSSNLSNVTVSGKTITGDADGIGNYSITFSVDGWQVEIKPADVTTSWTIVPQSQYTFTGVGTFTNVIIGVEIETSATTFRKLSAVSTVRFVPGNNNIGILKIAGGCYSYPDRRAKRLYVWYEEGGVYKIHSITPLIGSNTQNFAFTPVSEMSFQPDAEQVLWDPDNKVDYIENRYHLSEVNNPFVYLASRVGYVGSSSGDKITGFATNTLEVSPGQYGFYPLYVFCEHSIWGLEQGRDPSVAFERVTPISNSHGTSAEKKITNIDQTIAFEYRGSIYMLAGSEPVEIGQPIGNYPGQPQINFDNILLSSHTKGDRRNLMLTDGSRQYIYSLRYKRWYTCSRPVRFWFKDGGNTYNVNHSGVIRDLDVLAVSNVEYKVAYDPIHLLSPETLKRLFAVYVRGGLSDVTVSVSADGAQKVSETGKVIRVKTKSAYDFTVDLNGIMANDNQLIEGITAQVEARYPHKNRVYT